MRRAVIYCRVSTKEQVENLSLSTQQAACSEWCAREGFEIAHVFIEKGESAKTADRTELSALLEYCRVNKGKVHAAIVYDISRFARDTYDHAVLRSALRRYGVSLRSVREPIDDSPMGRAMENMAATFAQLDNDLRRDRTKAGMTAALERGRWTHQPPLGYLRGEKGGPSLVSDPERAQIVLEAFKLFATGRYTKATVREKVTALGLTTKRGNPVGSQALGSMLANPIYVGKVRSYGMTHDGDFDPIVPEKLFDKVQAILSGKRPGAVPHRMDHEDFPLRRFVRCAECNVAMTGSHSRGRNNRYAYYRCRTAKCRAVNIRKADLESKFMGLLEQLRPHRKYFELFRAIVLDAWKKRHAESKRLKAQLERQLAKLREREDTLTEAFLYEKSIAETTYERQRDQLAQNVLAFAEQLLLNGRGFGVRLASTGRGFRRRSSPRD